MDRSPSDPLPDFPDAEQPSTTPVDLTGPGLRPISPWERFMSRFRLAKQHELSNVGRVFNALDALPTGAHGAMLAPAGSRRQAFVESAQQAVEHPISLTEVFQRSRYPALRSAAGHPTLMGLLGFGEELLNPATYIGAPIGKARGLLEPGIAKATEAAGARALFDPLAGTAAKERSAAMWLAQEFKHADKTAQGAATRMFRGIAVEDRRTVSHLVEAMKPGANPEDQALWANAMTTRPDLIAKARELEELSYRTGQRKGLAQIPRGHLPHRPARERPEAAFVQTDRGVVEIPTAHRPRGAGSGSSRLFSLDPGSLKRQLVRSITDVARDPTKFPEEDAAVLTEVLERSAGRHESMQQFAQQLERVGALEATPHVDPVTGRTFASLKDYQRYALRAGLASAQTARFAGITPYALGKTAARYGAQSPEAQALRDRLAQRALARGAAVDIARALLRRREAMPQAGKAIFSESAHIPELLRGKQATEALVNFTNEIGAGEQGVSKLLKVLDAWNSAVRVGIIANPAYHPILNLMPQYESAAGGFGASALSVVARNAGTITKLGMDLVTGERSSLHDIAGPQLRLKLDAARDAGALAAIGTTNLTESLLRPGLKGAAARAWDWNSRFVFGVDDIFSAELFDVLTRRAKMAPEMAAVRTRQALGQYGAAFNTPFERNTLNRLFFFYPWMKTMNHWWLGGPGLENLKPIMGVHGLQQNYNAAAGVRNPNPLAIGNTVVPLPWRLLTGTLNDPLAYPFGWSLSHATPGVQMPFALAGNIKAPFSSSARYETGQTKPWARISTAGAPGWYQGLEAGRYVGETAVPGAVQVQRGLEGLQNQGIVGLLKGLMGATAEAPYHRGSIAKFHRFQEQLRRGEISFDTYLRRLQQLKPARKADALPAPGPVSAQAGGERSPSDPLP